MYKFFFLLLTSITFSLDFSDGPYGSEYFDIAGPFSVQDLNATPEGDITGDNILNIQDVVLMISYVIGNVENIDWFEDGDINNDDIIDVLDIVTLINSILAGEDPDWNFENKWNGEDCYIFLNYTNLSGALIASTDQEREWLITNSPLNVHYFFISDRTTYYSDIVGLKEDFDEVLNTMPIETQEHWNKHLHFIPQKTSTLNNWIEDALSGEDALGIDRFQRIRETGYLETLQVLLEIISIT